MHFCGFLSDSQTYWYTYAIPVHKNSSKGKETPTKQTKKCFASFIPIGAKTGFPDLFPKKRYNRTRNLHYFSHTPLGWS